MPTGRSRRGETPRRSPADAASRAASGCLPPGVATPSDRQRRLSPSLGSRHCAQWCVPWSRSSFPCPWDIARRQRRPSIGDSRARPEGDPASFACGARPLADRGPRAGGAGYPASAASAIDTSIRTTSAMERQPPHGCRFGHRKSRVSAASQRGQLRCPMDGRVHGGQHAGLSGVWLLLGAGWAVNWQNPLSRCGNSGKLKRSCRSGSYSRRRW